MDVIENHLVAPFGIVIERSGCEISSGGIGKETKEMRNAATGICQIILKIFYDYLTMSRSLQFGCTSIYLKITQPYRKCIFYLKV